MGHPIIPSESSGQAKASRTGSAQASDGSVAISGNVMGDIHLRTGERVRTHYRHTVLRLAADSLEDRDPELAELTGFCTDPIHAGRYMWWRAGAWAGKSALMAHFVLNPPLGVRIVSFFVTARLANQYDRNAFIENVLEQLCAMLGEDRPPFLTDSTREAHLLGMLSEAADACRARNESFILLVDGLDEDRGVTEPHSHSIASLLPVIPPAGMRVIVSSRLNPPLSLDVPDQHPLRDPRVVRLLSTSPRARSLQIALTRELHDLLNGSPVQRDLLGLLTAAIGGLTGQDLASLTGLPVTQIDKHLRTVTGRSFAPRPAALQPAAALDGYVLAHVDLQRQAENELAGKEIAGYRSRLHDWASIYRKEQWPEDTPEYLLTSYFGMLRAAGDLPRMTLCATDPHRQDRLLAVTGGDTAALAEITAVQDSALAHSDPDIAVVARLSVHRNRIADRNANIPGKLSRIWAALGRVARAEALAGALPSTFQRALALTDIAAAIAVEHPEHARGLLDRVAAISRTLSNEFERAQLLGALARTTGAARNIRRAEELVEMIVNDDRRARAVASLVPLVASVESFDRAQNLADSISSPGVRTLALSALARALVAAGLRDRANALVRTTAEPHDQAHISLAMVQALVGAGDLGRAEELARSITNSILQAQALRCLAPAAASGALESAEALVNSTPNLELRVRATGFLVRAGMHEGSERWAQRLASQAEVLAWRIAEPRRRPWALLAVAESVALASTWSMPDPRELWHTGSMDAKVSQLVNLAGAITIAGDLNWARDLAHQAIAWTRERRDSTLTCEVLTSLAEAAVTSDSAWADDLAGQAEKAARTDEAGRDLTTPVVALVQSLTAAGDLNRAETVIGKIDDPAAEVRALMSVLIHAGPSDVDRANRVANRALGIAHRIDNVGQRNHLLNSVAEVQRAVETGDLQRAQRIAAGFHFKQDPYSEALIAQLHQVALFGDITHAEELAQTITNPEYQAEVSSTLVRAFLTAGDTVRAEALIRSIASPEVQAEVMLAMSHTVEHASVQKLLVEVFRTGHWAAPLRVLSQRHPAVLAEIADEVMKFPDV